MIRHDFDYETDDGGSYVRDCFGGALDGEPLVAAQWCRPYGAAESGHGGIRRAVGRLVGKGDGLRNMNILAATDTRLVLYAAKTDWSGFRPVEQLGEWAIGKVALSNRDRDAVKRDHDVRFDMRTQSRSTLITVTLPDGRVVEFPRGPEAKRLIRHVNVR